MIRRLKQEEIPFIAENYKIIMKEQFEKVGEEPITKEKYKKILKENFENSFMFVLEEEGIKAFIWFFKEEMFPTIVIISPIFTLEISVTLEKSKYLFGI